MQYYQEDYPFLYLENGRIYSGDGNLNWRLWMWQDQIDYLNQNEQLLKGSGFKDKLYVFTINNTGYGNDRTGLDNINENLHNYFIQILSRGGIVHLILFLSLYYRLLRTHFIKLRKYDLIFYCVPLIWISLFDSAMENAHFPLIFYYFIGNIYFKEK
jgi:O-antigen ligase